MLALSADQHGLNLLGVLPQDPSTRCPSVAAPQFFSRGAQLPTPNANLTVDVMASTLAQLLIEIVTNPTGGGWFDRGPSRG